MHGHLNPYLILGGAIVGLLVGMTGAGGGSLMTPMLTIFFGVKVPTAIASDLLATLFIRPIGAAIHLRRGSVHLPIVRATALGAVPGALLGTFVLHLLGHGAGKDLLKEILGAVLLLGVAGTLARSYIDRRRGPRAVTELDRIGVRPLPTAMIGLLGGFVVGLTSVGAGTLMIILLLALYPTLRGKQLVGSDLLLAVPLTLAAAVGALIFGHVNLDVSLALVIGAVPGVAVSALLATSTPDSFVRPAITAAILASGLKYVGLDNKLVIGVLIAGLAVAIGLAVLSQGRETNSGQRPGRHDALAGEPGSG